MEPTVISFAYLVAAVFFILGLKGLTHPRSAVKGNLLGSVGMLLAVLVTLLNRSIVRYELIPIGLALGSATGVLLALRVPMTAMPQLVALFNGFGGGASVCVAGVALINLTLPTSAPTLPFTVAVAASGIVGAVTLWGSLVAFAKLQGVITEKSVTLPLHHSLNVLLGLLSLAFAAWLVVVPTMTRFFWFLVASSSLLGTLLVLPIGGGDMPVIIALLNSYSGIAAAATGFVLSNEGLIIAGALVGASGVLLTRIMCKAMNRSLVSILFGFVEPTSEKSTASQVVDAGNVKTTSADEVAMLLDSARRVVIAPGYGLAVAQAQHVLRDLEQLLESKGVMVEFGIHPVAGRMPGHMNVLLAEANVPYEKLKDMDEINAILEQTDVALVIGANDVVNPLAHTDSSGPIAGMPILEVDKAQTVVVIKRSLSPGFAGIANPLFSAPHTLMLFGDAKRVVLELIAALKES